MSPHPHTRRAAAGVFPLFLVFVFASILGLAPHASAASPAGLWDAAVTVNDVRVPFRFEIVGDGPRIAGSFFDGDQKVTSIRGQLAGTSLVLQFDQYGSTLEATWQDDTLTGRYDRGSRGVYPFRATRAVARAPITGDVPSISGEWKIAVSTAKGEAAWRFIVRQTGADVSAAILRVDGDTGTLTGTYADRKFVLSHFSGARPTVLEVTVTADGTLDILQNGKTQLAAVRVDDPRAAAMPAPTDPARHTRMQDPNAPFAFAFPDLDGHTVSSTDARFQGKVILVNITGSWCPNCHDEAPFLVELYRRYRERGLEIVALSFEELEQLENPTRLRAFIKRYGLEYTVLLAGEPEQLADKVPQAVNLNAFPTTFFLGRDGKVRSVHAGFPSQASGDVHTQVERDLAAEVETLLAEGPQRAR